MEEVTMDDDALVGGAEGARSMQEETTGSDSADVAAAVSINIAETSSSSGDVSDVESAPPSPAATQDRDSGALSAEDAMAQLRACKERGMRLELVLTKKNARLREVEETEVKLKRLLALAKRSIDNSKQDLAAKDAELEQLKKQLAGAKRVVEHSWSVGPSTRIPRRFLVKVAQEQTVWCLVEYVRDDDDDDKHDYAWHSFSTEKELEAYARRAIGEPLVLPRYSLAPAEVERKTKELTEELDRVKEEFRRYRVRAEISRKQKDAEIRKMSAHSVARQAEQIAETDVSQELQSARAQIRRLAKQHDDAEEREADWRRKFEKLMKDYEKLSGTMGETALATEWRERYEQATKDKEEAEKQLEAMKTAMASVNVANGADLFAFRGRLAAREQEIADAQALGGTNGNVRVSSMQDLMSGRAPAGGRGAPLLRRINSNSSFGSLEVPNATMTNEYLKNIVFKYMTTEQEEAREHMEKAIATVLNFTAAESKAVQDRRKGQAGWFW